MSLSTVFRPRAAALAATLLVAAFAEACAATPRVTVDELSTDLFAHTDRGGPSVCAKAPESSYCRRWLADVAKLKTLAAEVPDDPYVQGQLIYSLVRTGAFGIAMVAVDACEAAEWWCLMLRAFVLAESGQTREAEPVIDQALAEMPEDERCIWDDLSLLVPGSAWGAFRGKSCAERFRRVEELWWLSDPSWAIDGNDRRVEHYDRMLWAVLHDDALTGASVEGQVADGSGHSDQHHIQVVRFGMSDNDIGATMRWRQGGSRPTYGVIPDADALMHPLYASAQDWTIADAGSWENYAPRSEDFANLEAQVAFFERGDSLAVAAALDVPGEAEVGRNPQAFLFLGTDVDHPPRVAEGQRTGGRWLFRTGAPSRRYVVSVEAVGSAGSGRRRVGRMRMGHGLPSDPESPLRLSDVLLYTPAGPELPKSLEAAVPLMRGGSRWIPGETVGVFMEVYGPPDSASLRISVQLEKPAALLSRLGSFVGMGSARPLVLEWTEPARGGRVPLSVTLQPPESYSGEYDLRVSVQRAGMTTAVVEKRVRFED